ncbi:MAG: hypothetical protein ABIF11_01040 [Nitrospirota bacterium]
MTRIRFKNEKDNIKGFCELAKRIRVICLPMDIYEIGERGLKILDDLKIRYEILQTEGFDYAYATIRSSIATQV